jgi:methyl-accepting chemotaxis protein
MDQINRAVADMERGTQQNTASAEESASVFDEMSAKVSQMEEIVRNLNRFTHGTSGSTESR